MKPEKQRRRNGVIARLPRETRDKVNEMLDDGCTYGAIVEWLAENGHPGVNEDHVRKWYPGGFQDWLELDRELSRQERVRELSYDIATASDGSKTQEAAIQVAAAFLFQVLMKFDPDKLAEKLDMNPQEVTKVLNAFSRINRRGSEMDMIKEYQRQQGERRRAASEATVVTEVKPSLKPGLTDEGRAKIEQHYKLR